MSSLQDSRLKPSSILSRPSGVSLSLPSVTGLVISSSPQLLCYFNHTVLEIKRAGLSTINQSLSLVQPQHYPWQPTAHVHIEQQAEVAINGSVFQKPTKSFLILVLRGESNGKGVMDWKYQQTFWYHTGTARCWERGQLCNPIHWPRAQNLEVKLQWQLARANIYIYIYVCRALAQCWKIS